MREGPPAASARHAALMALVWTVWAAASARAEAPAPPAPPPAPLVRAGLAIELAPAADPAPARWAAADLYDRACRAGSGAGCYHFEHLMVARRPGAAALRRQRGPLRAACERGEAAACFRLGLLYDDAGGVGLDVFRALELYHRACDLRYDYACQRAAELRVVVMDPDYELAVTQVRALTKRSCDAGYGRACVVLANLVKAGKGGPRDVPRSRELLRLACARGQADACVRLAKRALWLAKRGQGQPADAAKELEPLIAALTPSCERGHAAACERVSWLLTRPFPAPQTSRLRVLRAAFEASAPGRPGAQEAAARAALEAACRDKVPWACERLASEAVRRDDAAAGARYRRSAQEALAAARTLERKHLRKRCAQGHAYACWRAAAALKDAGEAAAAKKLEARAARLGDQAVKRRASSWRAACDRGEPFGCVKLAGVLRAGRIGPADPEAAARLQARHDELVAKMKARWAKRDRSD